MGVRICDVCRGKKKVAGLGGMTRECYDCTGIGYIADKPVVVAHDVINDGMLGTTGPSSHVYDDGFAEPVVVDGLEVKARKKRAPNKIKTNSEA